jgi:glycosyltransferase involved in cell wall biosynthesis
MGEADINFDVLLPVWNGGGTLRRTLDSIFKQSFLPANLVIIVNGCSDDSEKIVDEFASISEISIFKITVDDNIGLVNALNLGLKRCTSNWVARIDADDYWLSDHLLNLRAGILGSDANLGLIGGSAAFVKEGRLVSYSSVLQDEEIRRYLTRNNPFVHSSVAFKLEVVGGIGTYSRDAIFEDYELWIRIMGKYKAKIISSNMCVHVRSETSLSAKYKPTNALRERLRLQLRASKDFSIFSPRTLLSIFVTACRWYFHAYIHDFHK